jgi:hypothetical protein
MREAKNIRRVREKGIEDWNEEKREEREFERGERGEEDGTPG